MPELPEVEITARLIGGATAGARVESALAPGINALKTYAPPLTALDGRAIAAAARAEAAVIELRSSFRGLRHLLALEIWRERALRRRLAAAVRRGAPRTALGVAGFARRRRSV